MSAGSAGSAGTIFTHSRGRVNGVTTQRIQTVGGRIGPGGDSSRTPRRPRKPLETAPKHLVSTAARLGTCALCRMPVLRALDEGQPAVVDLLPIGGGLPAEVTAIGSGRRTYARLNNGQLAYRDQSRLADNTLTRIHAQHDCTRR